jgi:hypothetical protein
MPMFNLKTKRAEALLAISGLLLLVLLGCEKYSPVSPEASEQGIFKPVGSSSIEAASNIGTIWILNDALTNLPKATSCDDLWHKKEYIKSKEGGLIEIGNFETGRSSLNFNQKALPADITVFMQRRKLGDCNSFPFVFEFGPEGTVFNNTVTVTLSYRTANLSGVPEDNLKIFYYNPIRNLWEFLESEVDKENKTVSAELGHFSRYAVAFSR